MRPISKKGRGLLLILVLSAVIGVAIVVGRMW